MNPHILSTCSIDFQCDVFRNNGSLTMMCIEWKSLFCAFFLSLFNTALCLSLLFRIFMPASTFSVHVFHHKHRFSALIDWNTSKFSHLIKKYQFKWMLMRKKESKMRKTWPINWIGNSIDRNLESEKKIRREKKLGKSFKRIACILSAFKRSFHYSDARVYRPIYMQILPSNGPTFFFLMQFLARHAAKIYVGRYRSSDVFL